MSPRTGLNPICALLLAGFMIFCSAQNDHGMAIKYPKNLDERKFIEQMFEQTQVNSDLEQDEYVETIRSKLQDHLESLMEKISATTFNDDNHRSDMNASAEILQNYLDLSKNISRFTCDTTNPEDLVYLLKFHADSPESKVYEYLAKVAKKQFEICSQVWVETLTDIMHTSLGPWIERRLGWLIDNLVQASSKSSRGFSSRYTKQELTRICNRPPMAGLVLYMCREGGLMNHMDNNMKAPKLSEAQLGNYMNAEIRNVCGPVCGKISPIAHKFPSLYRYRALEAENKRLLEQKQQTSDGLISSLFRSGRPSSPKRTQPERIVEEDNSEYQVSLWLTGKIVCCKLMNEFGTVLPRLHKEITQQPESYVEQASEEELKFADMIAKEELIKT